MATLHNSQRFIRFQFASVATNSTTIYTRTYDTIMNQFVKPKFINEITGEEQEIRPPKFFKHSGNLSEKAARNLRRSINTLLLYNDENNLLKGEANKDITFVTLTLPASQIKEYHLNYVDFVATDKEVKQSLNQFLTVLRTEKQVNNYVWVAEKQKNGNIHFHILLDKRIDWLWLRKQWNSAINKFGFVDMYQNKMISLYGNDYTNKENKLKYISDRANAETKNLKFSKVKQYLNAFKFGIDTSWRQPNSTDIHNLENVDNIAAYISKYMSKGEHTEVTQDMKNDLYEKFQTSAIDQIFTISGRIWQCSQGISKARKCIIEVLEDTVNEINNLFDKEEIIIHQEEHFTTVVYNFKQFAKYCKSTLTKLKHHVQNTINKCNDFLYNSAVNSNTLLSICDVQPIPNT